MKEVRGMKTVWGVKWVAAMAICGVLAGSSLAADAVKEKKSKQVAGAQFFALPTEITLTSEQQTKVDELKKEYADKLKTLAAARDEILSKDQRKARGDAQKAAKEAGKKGKDAAAAVDEATKWTDGQKEKYTKADAEFQALGAEIKTKVQSLLTDEQKAKLPKPKGKKNKPQA